VNNTSNMKNEQPAQKESLPEINWVRPDIQSEMEEIKLVAEKMSGSEDHYNEHYQQSVREIIDAMKDARLEELADEMWSNLKNTDSYHKVRLGHIEDAQKLAEHYNRDWRSLLDAIKNNAPMQTPIILITKDGVPHLVAGNTRLMIARALGAEVHTLIARLKEPEKS